MPSKAVALSEQAVSILNKTVGTSMEGCSYSSKIIIVCNELQTLRQLQRIAVSR